MPIPRIVLKSREDQRLLGGHLWVFSNEIERHLKGDVAPGTIVDVYSHVNIFLGRGFYNPRSLIAVRILTRKEETIDAGFFAAKIGAAERLRARLYPGETAYRLVFGESDGFPGMVIDRFNDCFVTQSYCAGMDALFPMVLEGLDANFKIPSVVRKNDSSIRELEGLVKETVEVRGSLDGPVRISQKTPAGPVDFLVDPLKGQKTGFYFDQRENRNRIHDYCAGKSVLDCFSSTGGFGVTAARCGAREVVSVDSGEGVCELLEKNYALNGLKADVVREDAALVLRRFREERRKFDIIVLDPPALAKSKKNLFGALRKYQELNELAMGLLPPGGILFSCSCSHHVDRNAFSAMLGKAAMAESRTVKVLEMRGQSRDHPVLPSMPETEYLKCAIAEVI